MKFIGRLLIFFVHFDSQILSNFDSEPGLFSQALCSRHDPPVQSTMHVRALSAVIDLTTHMENPCEARGGNPSSHTSGASGWWIKANWTGCYGPNVGKYN